ncbi:hypothetical protein GCM10020229_51640 [Kitasatospora albolonga]|uniref:sortase-dependent protein n=1 Tax=Kitasatospora albolonga TaxID=68173 RepID=UPI0031E8C38F
MAGTTNIRRALRFALVSAGVAGAVALSGAAAHADGSTPAPQPSASVSSPAAKPTAVPSSPAPAVEKPTASASLPAGKGSADPQVKVVPKGGAQTGEGESKDSTATLVLGSGLAAAGAAGIGFAVLRRRAGARG